MTSRNWNKFLFVILIFLFTVLVFLNNLLKKEKLEKRHSIAEKTDSSIGTEVILNNLYIAPRPYKLVYNYDMKKDLGEYVLVNRSDENKKLILRTEYYNPCAIPQTDVSPDNTKIILSWYCGDAPNRVLIGLDKPVNDLSNAQVLTPVDLDFGEIYNKKYFKVVSWIDNEHILFEETDVENNNSKIYWYSRFDSIESKRKANFVLN